MYSPTKSKFFNGEVEIRRLRVLKNLRAIEIDMLCLWLEGWVRELLSVIYIKGVALRLHCQVPPGRLKGRAWLEVPISQEAQFCLVMTFKPYTQSLPVKYLQTKSVPIPCKESSASSHWNLPDSYPDVKNKDYGEQIKLCWRPSSVRSFNSTEAIVMTEYDLYQVIRENDDLTPDHYQFFLYQLLRGLKYIHTSLLISSYLIICDFGHAQVSFSDAPSTIFWTSCRIMSQHDGIVLLNSVAPFFSKLCGGEASECVFLVPSDSMSSTLMIPASWDRLTPPVDTSPHDLHISYRMNLREKAWDHVRSAILGEKCDKLVASHGVVSHLEACDGWHCLSSDQDTLEDIY
ncbi:hypothetical protein OSB04_010925 [Centaurea solstitialis]|uniref:Protein kinase domain-containing protein n=1 Tax=Centaurea solstitialis TaxID=347529 RepID=A0AA38WPQ2_9ASTR|nr:hypothetical protein OSB04_010925 [Centaurea solstitialis]